METLLKDLRYGFRGLLKHPGFTAIVIITLGLGIGASTSIFSVVNSVVLRRLPYKQADRIVAIQEWNTAGKRGQVTAANFYDWRQQNTVFEHLAAIKTGSANLSLNDQAERIDISQTSANYFSVFPVEPQLGRLFIPEDEQAGHPPIAVLSYTLWQTKFGGNNDAGPVIDAYHKGVKEQGEKYMRSRFEQSAVRLLRNIFQVGLFENPYVDPARSVKTVGNPEFMKAGYDAQLKSIVLLKNKAGVLPVQKNKTVYPDRF